VIPTKFYFRTITLTLTNDLDLPTWVKRNQHTKKLFYLYVTVSKYLLRDIIAVND